MQACPFQFEVFTEESEGEIEIVSLSPFSTVLEPALCQLVKDRGIDGTVRDAKENVVTHMLLTPHLTTIVVENKVKHARLQNCSLSYSVYSSSAMYMYSILFTASSINLQCFDGSNVYLSTKLFHPSNLGIQILQFTVCVYVCVCVKINNTNDGKF